MKSKILENFLVEVRGMKKNDARLKVIAELEAIREEYYVCKTWKTKSQE